MFTIHMISHYVYQGQIGEGKFFIFKLTKKMLSQKYIIIRSCFYLYYLYIIYNWAGEKHTEVTGMF